MLERFTRAYLKVAPVILLVCLGVSFLFANCPEGSTAVPNANFYCGYDQNNVFQCWQQVDCIDNCDLDPTSCDEELARTPTLKVTRHLNGKLKTVHRLVIHTEAQLDGSKMHLWFVKDPDTKKMVPVVVPQVGPAPSVKLQALIKQYELAFIRQFKK